MVIDSRVDDAVDVTVQQRPNIVRSRSGIGRQVRVDDGEREIVLACGLLRAENDSSSVRRCSDFLRQQADHSRRSGTKALREAIGTVVQSMCGVPYSLPCFGADPRVRRLVENVRHRRHGYACLVGYVSDSNGPRQGQSPSNWFAKNIPYSSHRPCSGQRLGSRSSTGGSSACSACGPTWYQYATLE